MKTRDERSDLWRRRLLAGAVAALAMAASAYLTQTVGTVQAVPVEEAREAALPGAAVPAADADPSVPSAGSGFGRTFANAIDAPPPSY